MLRKRFLTFALSITLSWAFCFAIVFLCFNFSVRELSIVSWMTYEQRRLLMKFEELTFSLTTTLELVIAIVHMSFVVFYAYLREIVLSSLTITTLIGGDGQGVFNNVWIVVYGIFELLGTILNVITGGDEDLLTRLGVTISDNIISYCEVRNNTSNWFHGTTLSTDSSDDSTLPPLEPDPRFPLPQGPTSAPVEYQFVRPSPSSSMKQPSALSMLDSGCATSKTVIDPDSSPSFVFDPVFGVIPREMRDLWNQSENETAEDTVIIKSGHKVVNKKSKDSDSIRKSVYKHPIPAVRGSFNEVGASICHPDGLDDTNSVTHKS